MVTGVSVGLPGPPDDGVGASDGVPQIEWTPNSELILPDHLTSLIFNTVSRALPADRFVSLTERTAVAEAVRALIDEQLGVSAMRDAGRAHTAAKIALEIRRELVCCHVYDEDQGTDRAGKRHGICFWGEAGARIAEQVGRGERA
jgi:hypothetical protein